MYQISLLLICFVVFSCGENINKPLILTNTVTNTLFTISPSEWLVGTWQDVDDPYPLTNDSESFNKEFEQRKFTTNNFIWLEITIAPGSTNVLKKTEYINYRRNFGYLYRFLYSYENNRGKIGDSNYARYNVTKYTDSGTDSNYIFTILGSYKERKNGGEVKRGRFEDSYHFIKTGMTNMTVINTNNSYHDGVVIRTKVRMEGSYFKVPE